MSRDRLTKTDFMFQFQNYDMVAVSQRTQSNHITFCSIVLYKVKKILCSNNCLKFNKESGLVLLYLAVYFIL